ncbi:amidohydrolase [Muricoccus radiodurans]|uniref:amidohydrolase n=1 Tax=Muricoccus radiodurans TaxID=2231721 RepID=UPI003CF9DAEF
MKAELILHGGDIRTMWPERPRVEAVAIGSGRILGIGSRADLDTLAGPGTRHADLAGRMVLPGLTDHHLHLFQGARAELHEIRLDADLDFDALLSRVRDATARPGGRDWVIGGVFGPAALARMQEPGARETLDAVSYGRPVALMHVSAHGYFANSAALQRAGIDAGTPDPEGGEILRRPGGREPTGLLYEAAAWRLRDAVPSLTEVERAAVARHGIATLNRLGITGFADANATSDLLRAYRTLDNAGEMNAWGSFFLALSATCPGGGPAHGGADLMAGRHGLCGPHMNADFAKIFLDGVPSLRTAAMFAPYAVTPASEAPSDGGPALLSQDALTEEMTAFDRAGLTVKVHAIGERAIAMVLDAVEAVRRRNGADGPQHHIAHGNFIRPEDIARLARLNVLMDLNPQLWFPCGASLTHERMVGPARYASSWPIRSILESGATAAAGTDWPAVAVDPNPWIGLEGMITRRDPTGTHPGTHNPDEAITLETALPLFTSAPARALRRAEVTGAIRPGLSADLAVLDRNLFSVPAEEIGSTQVVATLFEGRTVHGGL